MKTYRNGEWFLTTPIYVGDGKDILKATTCAHAEWSVTGSNVTDGIEAYAEKCDDCVAIRVRWREKVPGAQFDPSTLLKPSAPV